jgi:hypothetical protein
VKKAAMVLALLGGLTVLWVRTSSPYHVAANFVASYLVAWGLFFLLSPRARMEKVKGFILMNASVGVTVGTLELLAATRVVDYRLVFSTPIWAPWRNPRYVADAELVHIRRPYERLRGVSRGGDIARLVSTESPPLYRYDLRYDRHGFRNEADLSGAEVAVLGDSYVEGPLVSSGELMTAGLASRLGTRVANLAQIGYGPRQQLVVLKRYALGLRPRIVVWAFFEGNDLKNVHMYDEMTTNWPDSHRAFHSFLERSFTKNVGLGVARLMGDPRPPGEKVSGRIRTADGRTRRMYFLYPGLPLSERDMDAFEKTRAILAEAYELCARDGIRLLVVYLPTKFRVYGTLVEVETGSDLRQWVLNDLPERFRQTMGAISPGIEYLDLTPRFLEAARRGTMLFFLDDSHWSPEGHDLAAQEIAERITDRPRARRNASRP